jgi:phage gp45-like
MPQVDNTHVRVKQTKTDDSGRQQMVYGTGRKDEQYGGTQTGVPVHQDYGYSAHRPVGSGMLAAIPDGNNDKAMMIPGEHPDYRPKDLAEGEWKKYEMWGGELYAQEHQWYLKKGASEVWFKDDGTIHLKGTKIILEVTDKVYIGGPDADKPVAMLGSTDDDSEINGPDALVGNLATKANVK